MRAHVDRCSQKLLSETAPASKLTKKANGAKKSAVARNLAFAAVLSRPQNKQTKTRSKAEWEEEEKNREARRVADWEAHKASMQFLITGVGEQVLNNWVLGKQTGK